MDESLKDLFDALNRTEELFQGDVAESAKGYFPPLSQQRLSNADPSACRVQKTGLNLGQLTFLFKKECHQAVSTKYETLRF